ncbi:MAG TPA: ABC transporter ATP-binding protein, partial [Conexibacter sp.]|nr:ABC transporter ATP-binding protein [Conexibacter sp.]
RPAAGSATDGLRVDMRGICKTFYGLAANADVDFDVRRGEVHALLGENGAGKSTLCSILAGLYRPDAGEVVVDGKPCRFRSPHDALEAGVGMVYQHYRLIDGFTVAENLALGHPQLAYRISPRAMERRARELMERYDIHVDPRAYIGDLSVGEQQRVEILSVLGWDVDVLILDEPTAVLTPQESERLFDAMRALAADGRGLVFVSHKLNEVMAVSDRITVLRDGRRVGTIDTADTDRGAIARMMVERQAAADGGSAAPSRPAHRLAVAPEPAGQPESAALVVRGLRVDDERGHEAVGGLDLDVRRGEIVGVAGVSGNGQRELADAIAGVRPAKAGSVRVADRDVTRADARAIADAGLAYVPEDRLAMGVASGLSLEENLALRTYRSGEFSRGPLLSHRAQARDAKRLIERFGIRGVRPGLPVRVLSGGNVQRAILARELSGEPQVVIAASPSRGLDVGAAEDVRALLREQRDRGAAVLAISEDLEELLGLADRIVVLYEGRIAGETPSATADTQQIGLWMAGSGVER